MKYSDYFVNQLVDLGYTHCFYVSGGNVMHLLESARTRMQCIAVTHEVSAVIAVEYFNVANRESGHRAVAFVTAGPGLTNSITGLAGAWLESREVLLVGGQARSNLLASASVRQIGHQEIDGVSIAAPITKNSVLIDKPISGDEIAEIVRLSYTGRKGPVFLEVCLDVTLMNVNFPDAAIAQTRANESNSHDFDTEMETVLGFLTKAKRPLLIVGGGLDFSVFQKGLAVLEKLGLPVSTTWNAADYLDYDSEIYAGRPNTYGMRWANAVIQQCDLLISFGARLGLQQTGFDVENFAPLAKTIRVEIDESELKRAHPRTDLGINGDANHFFSCLVKRLEQSEREDAWEEWLDFVGALKRTLPINERQNSLFPEFINPFSFIEELSQLTTGKDIVISCSSGGAYTTTMQAFQQRRGNFLTNNKGLASMGYGLAGAIGFATAHPDKRIILVEGDGGFAQNMQEVGTAANRNLNIKIFIFDNGGYASIRISQRSYFEGNYMGCDSETGIGLPDWIKLFESWGVRAFEINGLLSKNQEALEAFSSRGLAAFILKIHKDQPFLPKITSKVDSDGTISSNPIHLMNPPLDNDVADKIFQYLPVELRR